MRPQIQQTQTEARTDRQRALIALVLGAASIGFVPILVRLTDTGPSAGGFWRMLFALPVLALIASRDGEPLVKSPTLPVLLAGLFIGLDLAFWHYGIKYTSIANATVISNLAPVGVTILAWILFRERPSLMFMGGLALAVTGAVTMATQRAGGMQVTSLLGDGLSLATAGWYALYFVAMRKARDTMGAVRAMFWSSAAAAVVMLVVSLGLQEQFIPGSPGGWAACVGLAALHVTGQGLIAWALGKLPTSTASVTVLIQPVVAAMAGWMLFAEHLSPLQSAGGLLTLAGVVLAQRASAETSRS